MSNYSLSAHLLSNDPMVSLKRATRLINVKYKILHTTIQVEDAREVEVEFKCDIYH